MFKGNKFSKISQIKMYNLFFNLFLNFKILINIKYLLFATFIISFILELEEMRISRWNR